MGAKRAKPILETDDTCSYDKLSIRANGVIMHNGEPVLDKSGRRMTVQDLAGLEKAVKGMDVDGIRYHNELEEIIEQFVPTEVINELKKPNLGCAIS